MNIVSHEDFVKFLFDRPAYKNNLKWFFQDDFVAPELDNQLLINLICGIFKDIENISNTHSEKQLVEGLEYLIDSACGLFCYSFFAQDVPLSKRIDAISLMYEVFEKIFEKNCTDIATPLDRTAASYNFLCYMWWDLFPRHGFPRKIDMTPIDQAILENLKKILLLENIVCKKSALHGLGHWHSEYPEETEEIINMHKNKIPNSLKEYSEKAICGDIE